VLWLIKENGEEYYFKNILVADKFFIRLLVSIVCKKNKWKIKILTIGSFCTRFFV